MNLDLSKFRVVSKKKFSLSNYSPSYSGKLKSKESAQKLLEKNVKRTAELQDKLYADNKWALLIIFQAMDAAGKDGAIKHVMSGLNPQGTQVFSFKQPSAEEMDHDYLWRITKSLPERGRIGIFNRSHYEEVLVVRVHDYVKSSQLPFLFMTGDLWKDRFRQISNFERYLYENGILTVKFFLNVSKEEQKRRFLERIENPAKNWKFSSSDLKERGLWDEYQKVYEETIAGTAAKGAPWYIIPADKKWFARLVVSEVIVETLEKLNLEYPKLSEEQIQNLTKYKEILLSEKE
ncbi:MAG: polyphosphate--nucleotide phosphotransferase [Ignavibacteria bacterium CG22_combo_CG10-13_8_21_14_all_37_15]|nr:MAG: polyphosphate--nucleotide phosphotransferase [Ignavibacteria bacterium CG22_combo_CG10-13_8_21_14_all_37_15]